jgi:hypothetical protein
VNDDPSWCGIDWDSILACRVWSSRGEEALRGPTTEGLRANELELELSSERLETVEAGKSASVPLS